MKYDTTEKLNAKKIFSTLCSYQASLAKWLSVRLRTKWFWVGFGLVYSHLKNFQISNCKKTKEHYFIALDIEFK